MKKRVLCVWLPNWSIQRRIAARPELKSRPVAIHAFQRGVARVVARSDEAASLGVALGMPLAEAEALVRSGGLTAEPDDPTADREALRRLADWAQRFSPVVGLDVSERPECLFLDLSGVARLFGGEAKLAVRVASAFARRNLRASLAAADTLGAAWAVARFGGAEPALATHGKGGQAAHGGKGGQAAHGTLSKGGQAAHGTRRGTIIVPPGQTIEALRPLPLEALRLADETIGRLRALGIEQIGQVEALPRALLPARFGRELLLRLDQATGRVEETIVACLPEARFEVEHALDHPTARRETVEAMVAGLLERLSADLSQAGRGALRLECRLMMETADMNSAAAVFLIGLFQPSASAAHLLGLVKMHWEQATLAGPVREVRIAAVATAPLQERQGNLFADRFEARDAELAGLIDRLSTRLDRGRVLGVRLVGDAQPEWAYRYEPLLERGVRSTAVRRGSPESIPPRPLRLLRRPLPVRPTLLAPDGPPAVFQLGDETHRVRRSWGPERIETGWWRRRGVGRDYYRAETTAGRRFWLFRRLRDGRWFLHGLG